MPIWSKQSKLPYSLVSSEVVSAGAFVITGAIVESVTKEAAHSFSKANFYVGTNHADVSRM